MKQVAYDLGFTSAKDINGSVVLSLRMTRDHMQMLIDDFTRTLSEPALPGNRVTACVMCRPVKDSDK